MNFKDATTELLKCFTATEIADAIGCSTAAVKQARLDPSKPGHRPPPDGWRKPLAELARSKRADLGSLASALEK